MTTRPHCLLALDQGTSSSRSIVFDAHGRISRWRSASSARSIRSPAGWSTIRRRSSSRSSPPRARRSPRPGSTAARHRRDRHHQPARDHAGVEPRDGRADLQRDRLAGPPRRADLRARCASAGSSRRSARRPASIVDAYFSGTKLKWILDNVDRRARRGRARRARVRHRRHLADVAPHRRPRARHRRQQRLAHAAARRARATRGTTSCSRSLDVPRALLPEVHPSSHDFGATPPELLGARDRRSAASPATSRARCSARPASGRAWRRTPTAPAASC